jgi:hypothetical protein
VQIAVLTWAAKRKSLLFGNDMKSEGEMNSKQLKGLVILSITLVCGCKRSYTPPAITANNNYLVVEGVIAAGQDSTIIKLSRTVSISGTTTNNPERNATVSVQGDQNVTYSLLQIDTGEYGAPPLNLDNSHKYRLLITTADGRTYASDYEQVKITPPIDTVGYNVNATGLNIYTNAHDPANNTHYYLWDYTETYIYQSAVNTYYIYDPSAYFDTLKAAVRTPEQQIHICYVTRNSSTIVLNSSAALKQDVIQNNPIIQISDTSEKVLYRYSILVKQYALTQGAFEFWTVLKKNTQQIGTIFDPQPSEVQENIHCTSNPSEPVIGYVSVCSISQKRIFIDRSQLPVWPVPPYTGYCTKPTSACWVKGTPVSQDIVVGNLIPLAPVQAGECGIPGRPGYVVSAGYYFCVDCRYHMHGSNIAPGFWK